MSVLVSKLFPAGILRSGPAPARGLPPELDPAQRKIVRALRRTRVFAIASYIALLVLGAECASLIARLGRAETAAARVPLLERHIRALNDDVNRTAQRLGDAQSELAHERSREGRGAKLRAELGEFADLVPEYNR